MSLKLEINSSLEEFVATLQTYKEMARYIRPQKLIHVLHGRLAAALDGTLFNDPDHNKKAVKLLEKTIQEIGSVKN